tara:strand:- start:167 stop:538 length:372 start_codon:yes stop_codon:yes gene_type:complete
MSSYALLTGIGLLSGALGGIVGGGSDAIIVPLLVASGVVSNYKVAVGTSLATLLPPVGLFAVWNYYKAGDVKIWYSLWLALMFTIGSWMMARIGVGLNKNLVRKIYAVFLIGLALIILYRENE